MIVKRKITNSYVLRTDLEAHFGGHFGFHNDGERLTFSEIPEGVTSADVSQFLETWSNIKTDAELVDEENLKKEKERLLLVMDESLEQNAITAEAKAKIAAIKQKVQNVSKEN